MTDNRSRRYQEEKRKAVIHYCEHPGCDYNNVLIEKVNSHFHKLHSPRGREL